MRTEQLIADLASRATPVRPLASPVVRFAGWSAAATASAGLGLAVFGPRHGLEQVIAQPVFVTTAVLAIVTAALAATAALILAIPGAERSPCCACWRSRCWRRGERWDWPVSRVPEDLPPIHDWYICVVRVIAIGWLRPG